MSEDLTQFNAEWESGIQEFILTTSGSTGIPKEWILKRDLLEWSAEQTLKHFIRSENLHQLCCLPLNKVGGFMQLVRSKVWNAPIDIIPPTKNPLLNYTGNAKIASFTPMQLKNIVNNPISIRKLSEFKSVLIGGESLDASLEDTLLSICPSTHFVHTFGMTETYSHFAGRTLGEQYYHIIDNTQIKTSPNKTLQIKNPCTQNTWLATNDIVEIVQTNQFQWMGRIDFTINSGGIKIQLETVEATIQKQLKSTNSPFFCWWIPDEELGQKLVLYYVENPIDLDLMSFNNPYEKPKVQLPLQKFVYTETGKINRMESAKNLRLD
jgi:O-succinylbenzoic acid--CoA ligase